VQRVFVVWLDQPSCQEEAISGGKAASLSRLAMNYPVPSGFCLTTKAYERWVSGTDRATLPPDVRGLFSAAYSRLVRRSQRAHPAVAVRSSAVGEDGKSASFAGQYATYLNVSGLNPVVSAVTRCWDSANTEQVAVYQRNQGRRAADQAVAVLVQQLVAADVAFVAFSAHPVTGERDEVVINANWGLGESIVNGTVVPDTYIVRKSDLTTSTQTIAEKERMTILREGGVEEVRVPRILRRQATLSANKVRDIAEMAIRLESELQYPVDIEGAYVDDSLYLLQCRPISVLQ
jgi:pyruvate,water dikinase